MSHNIVRVNSNYKIQVPEGGEITLDTGVDIGTVIVTGDLLVKGETTTIQTTNLLVEDNVITLNRGELGSSVTEITSGIEIDRGTNSSGNAQLFWNEQMSWRDPATETTRYGLFVFQTKNSGAINGIRTNSIDTNGGNLALISKGTGVISVSGTNNYEQQVLNYSGSLEAFDDDIVPNIRAVNDKINWSIVNFPSDKIRVDDTQVIVYDNNISKRISYFDTFGAPSTTVRVYHLLIKNYELNVSTGSSITITNSNILNLNGTWPVINAGSNLEWFEIQTTSPVSASNTVSAISVVVVNNSKSNIKLQVDGVVYGQIQNTHTDLYNVRIQDTTIQSTSSNTDLILLSHGTGSVQIQDNLKIAHVNSNGGGSPAVANGNVKIYTNPEGAGNTGIYFVNPTFALNTGDYRRDELISKKKAIAFSILM